MIGFHYTSFENWQKIQKIGLKPYLIDKSELRTIGIPPIKGIWLWANEPTKLSQLGTIIYQISRKNSVKIVKLAVVYNENDRFRFKGLQVNLYHIGKIENYVYHSKEEGLILTKPISARNIILLETFDMVEIIENYEQHTLVAQQKERSPAKGKVASAILAEGTK